jgi:hypothetical protein
MPAIVPSAGGTNLISATELSGVSSSTDLNDLAKDLIV